MPKFIFLAVISIAFASNSFASFGSSKTSGNILPKGPLELQSDKEKSGTYSLLTEELDRSVLQHLSRADLLNMAKMIDELVSKKPKISNLLKLTKMMATRLRRNGAKRLGISALNLMNHFFIVFKNWGTAELSYLHQVIFSQKQRADYISGVNVKNI